MKKILCFILLIAMIVSFVACEKQKAEKYCSSCGQGISKKDAFCVHCGAATIETSSENDSIETNSGKDDEMSVVSNVISESAESSIPIEDNKQTQSSKPITTKPTHTHFYSKKETEATCTERGYTTYICTCGDTYNSDYTDIKHNFINYKCSFCGKIDKTHTFEYLKTWIIENGITNADRCSVETDAGYSITYYSSQKCIDLKGVNYDSEDETFLYMAISIKEVSTSYSYYGEYRMSSQKIWNMSGYIDSNTITENTPLTYEEFNFIDLEYSQQNDILELNRILIGDIIEASNDILKGWNGKYVDSGLTISDLGFTVFMDSVS